jgi:hypothetical protein
LSIAGVMIKNGWYDRDFIDGWSNGPFLIRDDNGRYLAGSDLQENGPQIATRRGPNRPVALCFATLGRSRKMCPDTLPCLARTKSTLCTVE